MIMKMSCIDAKMMDAILSYLVKNETARVKYKQIMDLLNVDIDKARYLHASILKYHKELGPIISIHNALNIAEKPIDTIEFLKKGGFEAIYKHQAEIKDLAHNKTLKPSAKSDLCLWINNNAWFTLMIATLGFVFGLLALLISLKLIKIN
jgi:hypothetical protein